MADDETSVQTATTGGELRHVNLVSGRVIQVQGDGEKTWFEETRDEYLESLKFTETTDQQDLDRLLVLELMIYRWTNHIAAGVDYDGLLVDESRLQRDIKLYSAQITSLKDSMGLSRKAREAEANRGDFSTYMSDLLARAKQFGLHREKQLDKALTLLNELFAIVDAFDRSDKEEREKIGFPDEAAILRWIRQTAHPEYRAIDEYFREHEQRLWIRDM